MARDRPSIRTWVRWVLTPLLLAGVVYLAATRPDWGEIGAALGEASAPWLVAAALVNVVSLVMRGAGWVVAARVAVDRPVSMLHGQAAFQIGQGVNTVVPGRVGEPAKVYVLNRHLRGDAGTFSALLGSVFVHRLMDVAPLAVVSLVVVLFGELSATLRASVIATIVLSAVLIALAARFAGRPGVDPRSRRLLALLDSVRGGFMVLRRRGPLLAAVVLEGVGWSLQIGVALLTFEAFGISPGVVAACAVVIATNAATLIPLWPGNVGLVQLGVAIALQPWGVPASVGVAYGLALQGAEMISALVVAGLAMLVEGLGFRDVAAGAHAPAAGEAVPASGEPLADPTRGA